MIFPRIVCADGFSVSVQARSFVYCSPRNDEGPWTQVELGFPSEYEHLIMEWAETPSDPTETVYGWVPTEVVMEVIASHGGTNEEGTAVMNAIMNGVPRRHIRVMRFSLTGLN
jgi:hypothetical protein